MDFPAAIVSDGSILAVYTHPQAFTGPDGRKHPASAWQHWDTADWAEKCPGWTALPVVDEAPELQAGEEATRNPQEDWTIGADAVTVTYTVALRDIEARRQAVVDAINAHRDSLVALGAPFSGKRVEMDERGKTDLTGMTIAALLASMEMAEWSEDYQLGWIAMDNERIPLPTAADGMALGLSCASWYGSLMQFARDLKDTVLASDDPEAVDIATGWPE